MDKETQRLLQQVICEVNQLRHDNEIMAAKIDGFEMAVRLANMQPLIGEGVGVSEDIVSRIEKHIAESAAAASKPNNRPD